MGGSNRDVVRAAAATGDGVDDAGTVAELQDRIDVLSAFTRGLLFEMDRDGRYLQVWTSEEQLLVRPANELIGRTITDIVGPALAARFLAIFRRVIDTGEPAQFEYSADVPAGRRTFSCAARPRDPRGGGERRITLFVYDITDAKALEAKLVQAEKLAALGLLAASVGHEIRQPLAYLFTSLDILEKEIGPATVRSAVSQALGGIRGGARRISEIAASLDLLAGPRRTTAELDIRRPLQAALDLCASALSRVRVEKKLDEVPHVLGDEGELCQVFANLLLNAVQCFVPANQIVSTIDVRVSVAPDGASVIVSVSDNGPGIAPDQLSHIFDPFFTTKAEDGGTGLGLFITRGIVAAHGGTLDVASESGRGTSFVVSLPRAGQARRTDVPASATRPSAEARTGIRPVLHSSKPSVVTRRRLQVLAIDDEPRFLESLRLALEDAHQVETRTSAAAALELLREDPDRFDVVLCDLAMPGTDGVTFYERMQEMGIADRFVVMTGGAFAPRAADFVRSGVCPSIGKPFLLERLLALLDEVTEARHAS